VKIAKFEFLLSTGDRCKNYSRNDSIRFIFQGVGVVLYGFLWFHLILTLLCTVWSESHIYVMQYSVEKANSAF